MARVRRHERPRLERTCFPHPTPTVMFSVMLGLGKALRIARSRSIGLALAVSLASCASLTFERTTETSGTFTSTGLAFTIFAVDIPKGALQIARENASDANLANLVVEEVTVTPYLGTWFDWLLDILSVRYARVKGTWGFAGP